MLRLLFRAQFRNVAFVTVFDLPVKHSVLKLNELYFSSSKLTASYNYQIMPPKRKRAAPTEAVEEDGKDIGEKEPIKKSMKQKKAVEKDDEVHEEPETVKKPARGKKTSQKSADKDPEEKKELETKPKRGRNAKKVENNVEEEDEETEVSVEKKEPEIKPKRGKNVKKVENNSEDEKAEDPVEKKEPEAKLKRGRNAKKVENNSEDEEPKESKTAKKTKATRKAPAKKGKEEDEKSDKEDDEESEEEKPAKKAKATRKAPAAKEDKPKGEGDKGKALLNKTSTSYGDIDFTSCQKSKDGKEWNFKISNWNVDGIRAWLKKGGFEYINYEKPDILCLQETKCSESKLPPETKEIEGYNAYWHNSSKEGYAGVGLYSKKEPKSVSYGLGVKSHDDEGRMITAEYDKFYVISVYVPNAGRGLVTLPKRLEWNDDFKKYVDGLKKKKPVIICGDMNVAHTEIDLANPKTNNKNAGFTKEEREGMTNFLNGGYIDTFRFLYPDKTQAYTFWSYMSNARAKNIGWRLDYFIVSDGFEKHVCDNVIRSEVFGSDHCPITLFLCI